jgi:hypothetical protein
MNAVKATSTPTGFTSGSSPAEGNMVSGGWRSFYQFGARAITAHGALHTPPLGGRRCARVGSDERLTGEVHV